MAEIRDEDWFRVNDTVKRLEHAILGNGKPPLEERLRSYIDIRDSHKERNLKQDMVDLRHDQDSRHAENGKKFDKLFQLVYIGMGIMIALESVGLFKK